MKKPTITQLWEGSLSPMQELNRHNPELESLDDLIRRNLETIEKTMPEPYLSLAQKYNDCVCEYVVISQAQAFSDGFSLGMRLLSEALYESEKDA